MPFRDDGAAAIEWVARYLERVGDYPVLAQSGPATSRPSCPPPRPSGASRSPRCCATSTRSSAGVTHWQHPRFFAWVRQHRHRARDPRRADRRLAEPGGLPLARLAGADRARGAHARLDGATPGPAARLARAHRGHRLDGELRRAGGGPRGGAGQARRGLLRARALVDREGLPHGRARGAQGPFGRRLPHAPRRPRPARRLRGVATVGTTSSTSVDPVPALADACERAGAWLHVDAAYAGSAMSVRSSAGRSRASSAPTRWWSTPTSGSSRRWTARASGAGGPTRCGTRSAWCPSTCAPTTLPR